MSKWIKKNYPDVKSDLFSSFVVRMFSLAKDHGECGVMSPFVWMFIGSYEKLRNEIIDNRTLTSLIQLEYSGFAGATVPICTYTFHNSFVKGYKGGYVRLSDFVGAAVQAPKALEAIRNPGCGWFYRRDAETFKQIPGTPIAYWLGEGANNSFGAGQPLAKIAKTRKGMFTGNNDLFLRQWYEVSCSLIDIDYKFYSKGGPYRRWYGNRDYVVRWKDDGKEIKAFPGSGNINESDYFKSCLCWSLITSGDISFRALNTDEFVMGDAGPACYPNPEMYFYLLGLLNSSSIQLLSKAINPTLNWSAGVVGSFPVLLPRESLDGIKSLVAEQVVESEVDWDSFETSWDFKRNPLV